jgi:hypothetical protein
MRVLGITPPPGAASGKLTAISLGGATFPGGCSAGGRAAAAGGAELAAPRADCQDGGFNRQCACASARIAAKGKLEGRRQKAEVRQKQNHRIEGEVGLLLILLLPSAFCLLTCYHYW